MMYKLFYLIFILSLFIQGASSTHGFHNKANRYSSSGDWIPYTEENLNQGMIKGGHDTLTIEALKLKTGVHNSGSDGGQDFSAWADPQGDPARWMRSGAHDEDNTKILGIPMPGYEPSLGENGNGNYFDHYYDPDTGSGYLGGKSAVDKAADYNKAIRDKVKCNLGGMETLREGDKQQVYDWFGKTLHLLQDMGNPSHTNDESHLNPPFENYLLEKWDEVVNSKEFKEAVNPDQYLKGNYGRYSAPAIEMYMHSLARISKGYSTEKELYDYDLDSNGNIVNKSLNQERLMQNVKELVPEVIKFTAGYINATYNYLRNPESIDPACNKPPEPQNPGGDHPDDRFDVSDEFYWDREFNLQEADLIDLFLRTGLKKGKIGIWYKKLFMQTFMRGREIYKNADQSAKDAIEVEFQAIKGKLEGRKNTMATDWKGGPDVALFANGIYNSAIALMLRLREPVSFQNFDFDPEIVKDHPVLLVPSGGFYGLNSSNIVKSALEEYVRRGGTLVVFGQQHGYDWELLPAPIDPISGERKTIQGYGYQQDQSCVYKSVYINTYHPILSVFSTSTADIAVDGYFTSYPENSTVLLRRTANGQPAMILYPYGNGQVIATTLYSDFGYGHNQTSSNEIRLVQNIIAWAKRPTSIPGFKPGETAAVNMEISNFTDVPASFIQFLLMSPDRVIIQEQTLRIPVLGNQSLMIPVSWQLTTTAPLGIYHIDYALLDASMKIIQPQAESDSGRFLIENPPPTGTPDKPLWFFVSTPSQAVEWGTPFEYTFHVINNTDEVRNLVIRIHFAHTFRNREWNVTANPRQETKVSGTDLFLDLMMYETMGASLVDETGKEIANYQLGFQGGQPSVRVTAAPGKETYYRNEIAALIVSMQNEGPANQEVELRTKITDPFNRVVLQDSKMVPLVPREMNSHIISFPLSSDSACGTYVVQMETWGSGRMFSKGTIVFKVIQSYLAISPTLPGSLSSGANELSFQITNMSDTSITSGAMDITFKDPDGQELYSASNPFTLALSATRNEEVPINLSALKFGLYTLTYEQKDETYSDRSFPVGYYFLNTANAVLTFEKPSYQIGEIANFNIELFNTGKFYWENASLTVTIPDMNYSRTETITLGAGDELHQTYAIPISETTLAGQHDVNMRLTLSGGGSYAQTSKLTVSTPSLSIRYSGPENIKIGDVISLVAENPGILAADVEIRLSLSGNGMNIFQNTISENLSGGNSQTYNFAVPAQATDGAYILEAEILNLRTGGKKIIWQNLEISGVKAAIAARTGRDIYLTSEPIAISGIINNRSYPVEGANLHLQIVDQCLRQTSYHFLTWDGSSWVERGVLHYDKEWETQLIDLSAYLPDAEGKNRILITQMGGEYAFIDSISLVADGTSYFPATAEFYETDSSILAYINREDNYGADVFSTTIEVEWTTIPSASKKLVVMRAREDEVNYSCREYLNWEKTIPIQLGPMETFSFGQGDITIIHSGQKYLDGTLRSNTGQVIGESRYPFVVIEENDSVILKFQTDKTYYRPGEEIRISGEVRNRTASPIGGVIFEIYSPAWDSFMLGSFEISPETGIPFSFSRIAREEGLYVITGQVTTESEFLAKEKGKYYVTDSKVVVRVKAPKVVGSSPFDLSVIFENLGKVNGNLQFDIQGNSLMDTRSLILGPGESKTYNYSLSIQADTTYAIRVSGDYEQTIMVPVILGERASLLVMPQAFYLEGKVSIPFRINNEGVLDQNLEVSFDTQQGETRINQQNRVYALAGGASVEDALHLNLPAGDYLVTASSARISSSVQANLAVRKDRLAGLEVSTGTLNDGLIPITANLTNLGFTPLNGTVRYSVIGSDSNILWSGQQSVQDLATQANRSTALQFDPSSISAGNYGLRVEFLENNGTVLSSFNSSFTLRGAGFQVNEIPPALPYIAGQEAAFAFRVRNTGDQEGQFELRFKAHDLIEAARQEWLKPGEEKDIPFRFMLPEDLEEKDYFAEYGLKGSRGQGFEGSSGEGIQEQKGVIKYHLVGINLGVQASLDRAFYREGDVAHLALSVSNKNLQQSSLNLFVRVSYPGFEILQPFSLNGAESFFFDIPLSKIAGEKLFFGIYHESGRSIHLNSLYIHKQGEVFTLSTDKQVYRPGEVVRITATRSQPPVNGTLTLSSLNYEESFGFSGDAIKIFQLPAAVKSGTYSISYRFTSPASETVSGEYPFDVDGISVKVKEAVLDKKKYNPADTINLSLKVESNQATGATLKTWLEDPDKSFMQAGTQEISLTAGNLAVVSQSIPFTAQKLGLHKLIYGVYLGDILLCAGSRGIDIGLGMILGMKTDRIDYPNGNEPVTATVNLFGHGSADVGFILDGQAIGRQSVALSGFGSAVFPISGVSPGPHRLKAEISSEGLISSKETGFGYGSGLPNLTVRISPNPIMDGANMKISVTAGNQGKTQSEAAILSVYDGSNPGGALLASFAVGSLNPGQYQNFTYDLNCIGKAGGNTFFASINLGSQTVDFNSANNSTQRSVQVPNLGLKIELVKENYSFGETIIIPARITNLAGSPSSLTTLITTIRDPNGAAVYSGTQEISPIDVGNSSFFNVSWIPSAALLEGTYTIQQNISGGFVSGQRTITLKKLGQDFLMAGTTLEGRGEIGEEVKFALTLTPERGFAGDVTLTVQNCPPGYVASFSSNPVSLAQGAAQTILRLTPNGQAISGNYGMGVSAEGGGRSHQLNLTLRLTDFQIVMNPGTQNIKQLETVSYGVRLSPLNGFENSVSIEIGGIPKEMRAVLNQNHLSLSGSEAVLSIKTSKWLLAGTYTLAVKAKGKVLDRVGQATLIVEQNPVIYPGIITVPGPMIKPLIQSFTPDGEILDQFQPMDQRASTYISAGDVDGDGIDEIIAGTGWKLGKARSSVEVFKRDGAKMAGLSIEFRNSLTVGAGDIDGDWIEEVAVGFYPYDLNLERFLDGVDQFIYGDLWNEDNFFRLLLWGRPGSVKVYKVIQGQFEDTGILLRPYETEGYRGAPQVFLADLDGDGVPELVTAPGPDPRAPAHIRGFAIDTREGMGRWKIGAKVVDYIVPFDVVKSSRNLWGVLQNILIPINGFGAHISACDLDGDRKAEIIVGAGPDPKKTAQVAILKNANGQWTLNKFTAFEGSRYGVDVACKDLDGDGKGEIITALGPGLENKSLIRIFSGEGSLLGEFQAYPNEIRYGVRVTGGNVGN